MGKRKSFRTISLLLSALLLLTLSMPLTASAEETDANGELEVSTMMINLEEEPFIEEPALPEVTTTLIEPEVTVTLNPDDEQMVSTTVVDEPIVVEGGEGEVDLTVTSQPLDENGEEPTPYLEDGELPPPPPKMEICPIDGEGGASTKPYNPDESESSEGSEAVEPQVIEMDENGEVIMEAQSLEADVTLDDTSATEEEPGAEVTVTEEPTIEEPVEKSDCIMPYYRTADGDPKYKNELAASSGESINNTEDAEVLEENSSVLLAADNQESTDSSTEADVTATLADDSAVKVTAMPKTGMGGSETNPLPYAVGLLLAGILVFSMMRRRKSN